MNKINDFIPFHVPSFDQQEIDAVVNTLKNGWVTTGPQSLEFENLFKNYLQTNMSCLALNSCTAALHLSMLLLNIKAGDEVITTPFTFIATANVIEYVGAKLILADIDRNTLNINPKEIEKKISSKTKAIIVVHYGGNACDMNEIMYISTKYNIPIIEDVAHGIGATYNGKKLGTFGHCSAFSFYANKNMTTIEGGMLCANAKYIEQARVMSLHGINKNAWKRYRSDGNWYYDIVYPGLKYNMTDISAAIGLAQLRKFESFQEQRKKIVTSYLLSLEGNQFIQLPKETPNNQHAWYNFPIRLNLEKLKIDRDSMICKLKDYMIGVSVHFIPVHLHSFYKNKYDFQDNDFPNAFNEFKRIICLPIYPSLSNKKVEYITRTLNYLCSKYAK